MRYSGWYIAVGAWTDSSAPMANCRIVGSDYRPDREDIASRPRSVRGREAMEWVEMGAM